MRKLAAHSVARRKREEAAKPAPMCGKATCAESPAPSISAENFRSPRASALMSVKGEGTSLHRERFDEVFKNLAAAAAVVER